MNNIPIITTQPTSLVIKEGEKAVFYVIAYNNNTDNNNTLQYQWYYNNSKILNATSSTYTIDHTKGYNEGNYYVIITNSYNTITSNIVKLNIIRILYDIYRNSPGLAYNSNQKKYYLNVINKNKNNKIYYNYNTLTTGYNIIYNPIKIIVPTT